VGGNVPSQFQRSASSESPRRFDLANGRVLFRNLECRFKSARLHRIGSAIRGEREPGPESRRRRREGNFPVPDQKAEPGRNPPLPLDDDFHITDLDAPTIPDGLNRHLSNWLLVRTSCEYAIVPCPCRYGHEPEHGPFVSSRFRDIAHDQSFCMQGCRIVSLERLPGSQHVTIGLHDAMLPSSGGARQMRAGRARRVPGHPVQSQSSHVVCDTRRRNLPEN
jgi:hypothetical protein